MLSVLFVSATLLEIVIRASHFRSPWIWQTDGDGLFTRRRRCLGSRGGNYRSLCQI